MKQMQWIMLSLCAALLTLALPTLAQDGNALGDPGMEGEYTNRGRADLNVPAPWGLTIIEQPRTADWMNLQPVAFPHNGPGPDPHSGTKALNFNRGYATFTVAIYQTVAVTQGGNVTASAWAQLKTCDVPADSDNCTSNGASGGLVRVGIDPNGGNNVFDGDIVWSANAAPHGVWQQMTSTATTTGTSATIFLYVTQTAPTQINNVYWDDAFFGGGGAGGAAAPAAGVPVVPPTAIPPQEVPFVIPQNARPDGSVVHIVGPGDTLDSIAVAYGMTRADILAINPDIRDAGYLLLGQEIIITAPGSLGGIGSEPSSAIVGETGISGAVTIQPVAPPSTLAGRGTGSRLFYYFNPQFDPQNVGGAINGVEIASAETPASFSSAPADATTTASNTVAVDSAGAAVTTTDVEETEAVGAATTLTPTPSASPLTGSETIEASSTDAVAAELIPPAVTNLVIEVAQAQTEPTPENLREPISVPDAPPAPVNSVGSGDVAPTFDPSSAAATLCVMLFNDVNLNRIQELGEEMLGGGVIIIDDGVNSAREYLTDGSEPHCLADVVAGDYIARASAPDGYGLTTPTQLVVRAQIGVPVNVIFGAAAGVIPAQAPTADAVIAQQVVDQTPQSNPVSDNLGLIVVGAAGVVLVIGLGATFLLRRR